jgi:hypothetical protein
MAEEELRVLRATHLVRVAAEAPSSSTILNS